MNTLSPTSVIWLGAHLFLMLLGMMFLAGGFFSQTFGESLAVAIGASLVASGITGLVLYLYVKSSEKLQHRIEIITQAGIVNVFRERSVRIKPEYDRRLERFRELDLVAYGLRSFRQDYGSCFKEWSEGRKVRILLPYPDFPSRRHRLVDFRDKEEGHEDGATKTDIEKFIDEVATNPEIDRTNFRVRYYRALPSVNVLRIDDEIFWGPYLMQQQSRNTPTLLAVRGGFVFSNLSDHFEALWEQSEAIPELEP